MRKGSYSANAHNVLSTYVPELQSEQAIVETIRAAVACITLPGLPRFTVSIGVPRHNPGESMDALFKRVDDALYRAKSDGRNKVLAA